MANAVDAGDAGGGSSHSRLKRLSSSQFTQGEDTVEYFLGLTPSGIIVLRNKTKVGNYFW